MTARDDVERFNAAVDDLKRTIWKQLEPLFRCLCRRWLKT
jgi:hypothetical protein